MPWSFCTRQAVAESVPFLPAEFSVFNAEPSIATYRQIYFPLPDPNLISAGPANITMSATGLNTNFPGYVPYAFHFAFGAGAWSSPGLTADTFQVACNGGGTAIGSTSVSLQTQVYGMVRMNDNLVDELSGRVLPVIGNTDIGSYSFKDASMTLNVVGGQFNGKTITLHGKMAYGSAPDPSNDSTSEAMEGDVLIALEWGIDPLGNDEYMLLRFSFIIGDNTTESDCLPLPQVSQHYYSSSLGAHFGQEWSAFLAQLDTTNVFLQGAIPDLLYLYDFSANNSVPPANTVTPGMLDMNTVIPFYSYTEYTNVYKVINQYDAGVSYNLPKRFQQPNPVPPPSGYTPGGNACGPTSLGMMLYANGVATVNAPSVFDNTTDKGLAVAANDSNGFYWDRAYNWLASRPKSGSQKAFSAPSPLPAGKTVYEREATDDPVGSSKFTKLWDQIDTLLSQKQPVEIRTDLSLGSSPGGGHCILLLGVGHNDNLKQIYPGISGDYYIVGDPAGHYYANSTGHYDLIDNLIARSAAINYGGWFAMYPKEYLRQRFEDTSESVSWYYRMEAITIGAPFKKPTVKVKAHSPVTLLVTDPIGRQTGTPPTVGADGLIPESLYEIGISDEMQTGGDNIDPDGPKTVEFDDPMDGLYQVQLTGTNNGAYTLEWTVLDTNSLPNVAQTNSGSISTGQHLSYPLNIGLGGIPAIQSRVHNHSLVLYWPTNTAGFVMQTNANPANATGWTQIGATFSQTNGVYSLSNNTSIPQLFFRLKK